MHVNVRWPKLKGTDGDKGLECVTVEEVETGDQSAEAQQSYGMLTFEGLAV